MLERKMLVLRFLPSKEGLLFKMALRGVRLGYGGSILLLRVQIGRRDSDWVWRGFRLGCGGLVRICADPI